MTRTELTTHLEKIGLPTWGTDAELAQRWELNKPKGHKPMPAAAVSITPMGNSLLANRASLEAPMTDAEKMVDMSNVKVLSEYRDESVLKAPAIPKLPSVQAFNAPRKPGRPKGS